MKSLKTKVEEHQAGTRLDVALAALQPQLSRRKIRLIIDLGGVYLNRRRIRVASRPVQAGDILEVTYNETNLTRNRVNPDAKFSPSMIIYDNNGLIAINKPAGLASQATRDSALDNAEKFLNDHLRASGDTRRATLLHRLDRETSGVLLFGTTPKVVDDVSALFKDRGIDKTYWAICLGVPTEYEFEYECNLSDIDPKLGFVRRVRKNGKFSHTAFRLMSFHKRLNLSMIECKPTTGRSHQIRIHLDILGTPIMGDKRYGKSHDRTLPRELSALADQHHYLHARSLEFYLGEEKISIEAEPPKTFTSLANKAELSSV